MANRQDSGVTRLLVTDYLKEVSTCTYKGQVQTIADIENEVEDSGESVQSIVVSCPAVSPLRMRFQDIVTHVFGEPHYNPYEDDFIEGWSFEQQRTFIMGIPHLRMVTEGDGAYNDFDTMCEINGSSAFIGHKPWTGLAEFRASEAEDSRQDDYVDLQEEAARIRIRRPFNL